MKRLALYFDNYITNVPYTPGIYGGLDFVRDSCEAYKLPDKLSVAKYTLASYAKLDFSSVLIRYELQDPIKSSQFESFAKSLFPEAKIINGRSDSRAKFLESVKILKDMSEEWVFYSGNADHPFIAPSKRTFEACFEKTKQLALKHHCVAFHHSHFQEHISSINPSSHLFVKGYEVMEENDELAVIKRDRDPHSSQSIVSVDLFEEWFSDPSLEGKRIVRTDSIIPITGWKKEESIMVIPKKEVCRHFDGYSHLANYGGGKPIDAKVPPLFIPKGFFEGKIKVAYGYDDYREGYVNVNPLKEDYSFEDQEKGTDLKLPLQELPLFWQERISEVDSNPALDKVEVEKAWAAELALQNNIWAKKFNFAPADRAAAYYWRLAQIVREPEIFAMGIKGNKTVPLLPAKWAIYHAAKAANRILARGKMKK
jgi:hypothetical protein